jgi:hypothetical protein
LIDSAERVNKLVDAANEAEANAKINPAHSNYYRQLAAVNRQAISQAYQKMAAIMVEDLRNIRQNNPKMVPHAQEVIRGLQESAQKVRNLGSHLSKFYPQNIRAESESPSQTVTSNQSMDRDRNLSDYSNDYTMLALAIKARDREMQRLGLDVLHSAVDLDVAIAAYAHSNQLSLAGLINQSPTYQALSGDVAESYKESILGKAQAVMATNHPGRSIESQR